VQGTGSVIYRGLRGVRILDLTTNLSGAYATKLLADAGAEVISFEPPDGHPLRRWSSTDSVPPDEDGALWQFLHTSKRSVRSSVPAEERIDLISGTDVIFESGTEDIGALRDEYAQLVVVSVTGWGRTGPWAERPWTQFVVEAAAGSLLARGLPTETPYQAGGRLGEWIAGSYAAAAAIAAVGHAQRTGAGTHVDCSIVETMAVAGSTFADVLHSLNGRPAMSTPARWVESPSIEPAADGWIGFNTNSGQMFQNFLLLIEQFDLLDDPKWADPGFRIEHPHEWAEKMHAWTREHSIDEILERAAELRIACAPVHDGETILANEHLVARGVFVSNPAGFVQPRTPYVVDSSVVRPFERAPALGEADGMLTGRTRPAPREPQGAGDLPLAGVRVLDVTSWWAGPSATHLLACLGAEVIHIESPTHPDGMRTTGFHQGRPEWWEWGHLFLAANTNKLDVTLDLGQPRGLELLLELVRHSDLVVENFAPRVAEGWGLTWDAVRSQNSSTVFVRMPAFGLDGPWRERVGFAQTIEQMSGMAWITGPFGGPPRNLCGPADPIAGMHAAVAMLSALEDARRTGQGRFIEAVMVEASINCAAEQILEFSAYGQHLTRTGNRSPGVAPQGLYACRGIERWLALSVATDDQWVALRKALGEPAWAADTEFDTLDGRQAGHDALDAHLAAWAREQVLEDAVERLVEVGVPAVVAWSPRDASSQPQLAARQLHEDVPHPAVGTHTVPGLPFRWSGIDHWTRAHTPLFGEHSREVLSRLIGLTDADLDELEASGIIGTRPVG